jgi:hypothetical protein
MARKEMATYYYSGVNRPVLLEVLARQRASGMVNALYAGQRALLEAYERHPEVSLVLDSGACQGYRDVEAYARLIRKIGKRMLWCANMDELHNQQVSDERYRRLKLLLADDEECCEKLVWVYQCQSCGSGWHRQGDLHALRRAVEHHRFIGIGGFISVMVRDLSEAQDLLCTIGAILDEADAQAHVFGLGNFALLVFACAQRWFRSADSTRWLQGLSSRTLLTTDGKYINARKLTFTGLQCAEQNVGAMQTWMKPGVMRQLFLFPHPDDLVADQPASSGERWSA